MNDYKISEILHLKKNLMDKNRPKKKYSSTNSGEKNLSSISHNSKISDIVEKEITKMINSKTGKKFENNIREILEMDLHLKEGKIKRDFFYREISFKNQNKKYIICPNKNIYFLTNKGYFKATFKDNDYSCEILNKNTGEIVKKVEEKNDVKDVKIVDKYLSIGIPKQFEIDALYKIREFDLSIFDKREIEILYNNINEKHDFSYVAIEIKLSQKKIPDMIKQLIDDKKILKKIIRKPILYLGIVNYEKKNAQEDNNIERIPIDLDCLILGVKNGVFFGREVNENIDWKLISDFMEFKVSVENQFLKFEKKFLRIEKKIDDLTSLLQKKLKREKE